MNSQNFSEACDVRGADVGGVGPRAEDRTSFPSETALGARFATGILAVVGGGLVGSAAAGAGGDAVMVGLAGLAFVGGLLSTWSPCGYSSLSTLRPVGGYGPRSVARWSPTLVMHALGYALAALLLGGALGLAAMALPFAGYAGAGYAGAGYAGWPAVALGAVALGYGLDQLKLFRMPYPQRKAQVPHDARARYPMWGVGLLYGFALGLNFLTYVRTPILYVVVGAALIGGSLPHALLLVGALNLGRFVPLLVNALPVSDSAVQGWLASTEHQAVTLDGVLLAFAGVALIVFGLA